MKKDQSDQPKWAKSFSENIKFMPLGNLVRLRNEKNDPVKLTQVLSLTAARGVILYEDKGAIGNNASEDITRYSVVRKGDIVVNSMNVIIGSVGLSQYDGVLSPVYYVLTPIQSELIDMRYLAYHFQIQSFQKALIKIGYGILDHRMRIPWIKLKAERIAVPPINEQRRIADYLDEKIGHHNLLIEKRNQQISATLEVAQSQLSDIFLSGPGDKVPIKRLIKDERLGIWGDEIGEAPFEVVVARVADFNRKNFTLGAVKTVRSVAVKQFSPRRVLPGDILLERSGGGEKTPVGCAVQVTEDLPNLVCSNFVSRIRSIDGVNSEYLALVLAALYSNGLQTPHSSQTTGIQNLDTESYFQVQIPKRSMEEQLDCVARGRKVIDGTTEIISGLERFIGLIAELKSSLIAEAVTGQIDVTAKWSVA